MTFEEDHILLDEDLNIPHIDQTFDHDKWQDNFDDAYQQGYDSIRQSQESNLLTEQDVLDLQSEYLTQVFSLKLKLESQEKVLIFYMTRKFRLSQGLILMGI